MKLSLGIIVIILAIYRMDAKRDLTVDIHDGNITIIDMEFVKSVHYQVYNRKAIYVDLTLKKNITEFDININVNLIKKDNRPTSFLSFKMNGCEAIRGGQKGDLLKVIYREIFRVTNLPKKCPILADTFYYFNNFSVKDDYLPIMIPMFEWQMHAEFLVVKKVIATAIVNGRVRKL